ncbi:hypothetical protein HAHI6034_11800 [Hathewaya histolytica]|uniref:Uncharacterized protein n=1 Tax=Hathewaya histolytica TaxID=1498 RepID=A0A4U9RJ69_HATHI|nr:hypothetical protein [Hathewaya histolytica]VTQ88860.1 Uncharacterised protein [Hathewaya histolytica]
MKLTSKVIREAHKLTKDIKTQYPEVDYKTQLGICLSFLLSEKKEVKEVKKVRKEGEQLVVALLKNKREGAVSENTITGRKYYMALTEENYKEVIFQLRGVEADIRIIGGHKDMFESIRPAMIQDQKVKALWRSAFGYKKSLR